MPVRTSRLPSNMARLTASSERAYFYITLVAVVVVFATLSLANRSRTGRAWQALHDERDPVVTTSMRVVRERVAARLVDAACTTTRQLGDELGLGRAAVAIVVRDGANGPQMLQISLDGRRLVASVVSNVLRSRLLMPTRRDSSRSARSSSVSSCTSISTSMPYARAAAVAQQHRETEEEDHQDVACQMSQTHGVPPLP